MSKYDISLHAPDIIEDKYPKNLKKSFSGTEFHPMPCIPKVCQRNRILLCRYVWM